MAYDGLEKVYKGLAPETIKRLCEIENTIYYINMKDRWDADDRQEYAKLTAERERLRKGVT